MLVASRRPRGFFYFEQRVNRFQNEAKAECIVRPALEDRPDDFHSKYAETLVSDLT